MKVTLDPNPLREAVAVVARHAAAPGRDTDPLLTGLLIEATDRDVRLRATDRDVFAAATIPGVVHDPGASVLPARLLADVVARLGKAPVELVVDGRATLTSGATRLDVPTQSAEHYPAATTPPAELGRIDAATFRRAVARGGAALGDDRQGPPWNTLALLPGPRLELVSTDRYRYASATVDWTPTAEAVPGPALVPGFVAGLARDLPASGELTLRLDGGRFGLSWEGRDIVVSRVLVADKELPNYARGRAMATRVALTASLDREELTAALARVAPAVDKSTGGAAKLGLRFTPGSLELTARSDAGALRDAVALDYTGPELGLACNWAYLKGAADACGGQTLRATFPTADPDPLRHRLICLTAEGDADYLHTVALIRGGA